MCCFVPSNGILFVVGSIHQGADRLSDVSRGIKWVFELCSTNVRCVCFTVDNKYCGWDRQTVDRRSSWLMYLKLSFWTENCETMRFTYQPDQACWPTTESNKLNEMHIGAQITIMVTITQLPAVAVKQTVALLFPFLAIPSFLKAIDILKMGFTFLFTNTSKHLWAIWVRQWAGPAYH